MEPPAPPDLPGPSPAPAGDDSRPSGLDATVGSNARFEMAYTPPEGERITFGAPLAARLPAYAYLLFASLVAGGSAWGYAASPGSHLYRWVVEGDRGRPMTAGGLSLIIFLSAVGTVVRSHMRGVVVHADSLEARYLLPLGFPRVRRWAWAQVFRMDLGTTPPGFALWDGTYERLPEVADGDRLVHLLLGISSAHHIRVTRTSVAGPTMDPHEPGEGPRAP